METVPDEKKPLSFTLFFLRVASGLGGGISGTLIALMVYFLMSSLASGEESNPLSIFAILAMAFVATLTANTISALMISIMDNQKYKRRKTIVTHVFIFNLILFLLSIPIYLVGFSLEGGGIVSSIVAMHFLISAFVTSLILEVLAGYQYSLLGIYSSALGIIISLGLALAVVATSGDTLMITFGAMPMVWFILTITSGIAEIIYDNFLTIYGVDALNTQTDLGGDIEAEAIEKEIEEDQEDDEGL